MQVANTELLLKGGFKMNTYKIVLIEKIKVTYQVEANSEEEALIKARNGNATYCDGIMVGDPSDYFELEVLE